MLLLFFLLSWICFTFVFLFLESSISTSNLPNSFKKYLPRYLRNRIPVLAKLYTGIWEVVYRYWPNHIPVLAQGQKQCFSYIHLKCNYPMTPPVHSNTYFLVQTSIWQNHIPVLTKKISPIPVYDFVNTGIWFCLVNMISECWQ